MWCTTKKPKSSSYTRSLTKLFERISFRLINNVLLIRTTIINKFLKTKQLKKNYLKPVIKE